MFHFCSPYCGHCKPPLPPARLCPSCGKENPQDPKVAACTFCGAALPDAYVPVPVFCNQVEEVCANPCDRAKEDQRADIAQNGCPYHTTAA